MVEIPFFITEALFALIWVLCRAALWLRRGRKDLKREAVLLLMFINLAVIIRFTFFPMDRADGRVHPLVFDSAAVFPFRINAVPFVNLFDYDTKRNMILNITGNTALFIPSGIVLPVVYKKLGSLLKVAGAGAAISLCIEVLQLPFYERTTDVDDLILNTLGVVIGYGVFALIRKLRNRSRGGDGPADRRTRA